MGESMIELYSYDIFDTVITRKVATPSGIFAIMQASLIEDTEYGHIPAYIRNNFVDLRMKSEQYARIYLRKSSNADITIEDIYYAMDMSVQLGSKVMNELIQLEERIEIENAIPVTDTIRDIKEKRAEGKRVVFISDMYLSKRVIAAMLDKADGSLSETPLYVSCECGYTKASGTLFGYVKEQEQVEYQQWQHTGDHGRSDVDIPGKLGIRTVLFSKCNLLNIEKQYLDNNERQLSAQYWIGLSRQCRIHSELTNSAFQVGTSLGGVLLVSYASYVVQTALDAGIKNLYFIARDGYVIKELADIIIEENQYPIQTKYIYGSRKVWRVPSLDCTEGSLFEMFQASASKPIHTIKELAKLLQLTEEELLSFLPEKKNWQGKYSFVDISLLVRYLEKETTIKEYMLEKNRSRRNLASAYLKSEIGAVKGKIAFVEIGGTGYTQKCLEKILRDFYSEDIKTFYLHMYGKHKYIYDSSYIFLPGEYKCKDAIEPLCRALHGQTIDYEETEQGVVPVLAAHSNKGYENCNYGDYLRGLKEFARLYTAENNNYTFVNLDIINKYWDYFTEKADSEILDFFGEVPFDTDDVDGKRVYAPKLEEADIKEILQNGVSKEAWYYNGEWSFRFMLLRMSNEQREQIVGSGKDKFPTEKNVGDVIVRLPKEIIGKYNQFAVYGAGRFGKNYVRAIEENGKEVVAWIDKEYIAYQQKGQKVSSVDALISNAYDCVVIAVVDEQVAQSIASMLLDKGIDKNKIVWASPKEIIEDWIGVEQ